MPKQHPGQAGGPSSPAVDVPDVSTVWLRAFLAVARHGSFTVAARRLGWTQSAVSRQISSLEAALGGAPLFDRLPRGVRLTEAGRVLVPYAESVAETLHGAARELTALHQVAGGRLRFGAFPTADAALVPHALAAFRTRHPGVRLSREEGLTPRLLDRLSSGHLDLAVVSTTAGAPLESYDLHHLLDESLYVAVPADHPLAVPRGPVRLGQLADADWISGSSAPRAPFWTRPCARVSARVWRTSWASGPPNRGTSPQASESLWSRPWPPSPCAPASRCCRYWTRALRRGRCTRRRYGAGHRHQLRGRSSWRSARRSPASPGRCASSRRGCGDAHLSHRHHGVDHFRHAILRASRSTLPHSDGRT